MKLDRYTLRVYAVPIAFVLFLVVLVLAALGPQVTQDVSALF